MRGSGGGLIPRVAGIPELTAAIIRKEGVQEGTMQNQQGPNVILNSKNNVSFSSPCTCNTHYNVISLYVGVVASLAPACRTSLFSGDSARPVPNLHFTAGLAKVNCRGTRITIIGFATHCAVRSENQTPHCPPPPGLRATGPSS